jgi:hypothetical protein
VSGFALAPAAVFVTLSLEAAFGRVWAVATILGGIGISLLFGAVRDAGAATAAIERALTETRS